jgi:hypothetical protein
MSPNDRDYFATRARQELAAAAAAGSNGTVRDRHEELAWLYQMRVIYFDRGITGEEPEVVHSVAPAVVDSEPALIQHITVPA